MARIPGLPDKPAEPVSDPVLPEALKKPISEMTGPNGISVGREAPPASPTDLRRMYRRGMTQDPLRSVHDNGHIGLMRNNAEALTRKIHRRPAQMADLTAEDRLRVVPLDGKLFHNGSLVTIAHKDDVAEKRADARARFQMRRDPIKNLAQRMGQEGDGQVSGFSQTKADKPIQQGDAFEQKNATTAFVGSTKTKAGVLQEG